MKKQFKWIWYVLWLLVCLVGGGCTLFSWMPRTPGMFYGGCAMLVLSVMLGTAFLLMAKGKPFKKALLPSVIAGAVYTGVLALIVYLCDVVIFANSIQDYQPVHSSLIVTVLSVVLTVALIIAMPKKYDYKLTWLKRSIALILACVALALGGLPQNYWWGIYNVKMAQNQRVSTPVGFSTWTAPSFGLVEDADFYVSVDGSDENDGSLAHPFASIDRAKTAVRDMDKTGKTAVTVAVKAGEYRVSNLTFTAEDSGTAECPVMYCAYGDGEVILNAGVSIDPADFTAVTDEAMLSRLQESVRGKVVCVDLDKYGLTTEDLGKIYAFGEVNTAKKYDGDYVGPTHCELFVNDQRQTIARYPNAGGWQYTDLVKEGVPHQTTSEAWNALPRNPDGDTYALTQALADRIRTWQDIENVWLWGYLSVDWAFCTNLIEKFDYENLTMTTKFCSRYGARDDAAYYYFNVFEELDTAGEWYLDRENCVLYLYQPENMANASIEMSISQDDLLAIDGAEYLTFRGFTLQGTRGDAVEATGNHLTVEYCLIHNIGGYGIIIYGDNNLVANNEVTRTGMGGIELGGGDQATLTPGNSRVYNNLIHDWGETNGYHGIRLRGVGNLVDHNELYNYRDVAINHYGNNHIIEYNLIHDVSLQSNDASAIYTGTTGTWGYLGTVVRYNAIYNVGTFGFCYPNGIYVDDAIIGQSVYGNLLVNVPDNGILVGGGREHNIWGNVIINTGNSGISYDQRTYEWSAFTDGYLALWQKLQEAIGDQEIWEECYPYLKDLHVDETNMDDPMYVRNPANSKVNGNLFINWKGELGNIADKPAQYSDFSGNAAYTMDMLEAIFVDPANGDYRLREDSIIYELIPDFEQLPIEKMGRE